MGKVLIIKNADFKVNSIEGGGQSCINITSRITTFVDGVNGVKGIGEMNRKGIFPRFSIEQYRQLGYSIISVNVKSLGCYPFVTSVGPTGNAELSHRAFGEKDTYIQKGVYSLDLDAIDPNKLLIYFSININKDTADISSNNLSDYIEITMEK